MRYFWMNWARLSLPISNITLMIAIGWPTVVFCSASAPALLYPKSESTAVSLRPYFTWDDGDSPDSKTFVLSVCKNPDAYTNCWSISGNTSSGIIQHRFLDDLAPGIQYYWRVKYISGDSWGPASEIFPFHTALNTTPGTITTTLDLKAGWNLVSAAVPVPISTFMDQTKFISIWSWANSTWSISIPGNTDGGSAYAYTHGLGLLSSIIPGEGFWVNSKDATKITLTGIPATEPLSFTVGWNLVGVKNNDTPLIVQDIAVKQKGVISIWKWEDNKWGVNIPGESAGGAAYANIKGFAVLDVINPGEGFWVNIAEQ